MPSGASSFLVETDWLAQNLDTPDLVVFDGTWHLPYLNRDARADYRTAHIPGALFFDIDELSDEATSLPHMLPPTTKFASRMKQMGVGDGLRIVVYDQAGIYSAPRVWWTLRVMGHKDVAVLNGGLRKWLAEGRPVEDGVPPPRSPRHFTPRLDASLLRDIDDMRAMLSGPACQVADARPAERFTGREPEPRPGLRPGHMPGARNVPYDRVLNADGTMKSADELRRIFSAAGINPKVPVVTTCGSGITAAILALALAVAGNPEAAVYDGSWAEWGQDNGLPVATGEADGKNGF